MYLNSTFYNTNEKKTVVHVGSKSINFILFEDLENLDLNFEGDAPLFDCKFVPLSVKYLRICVSTAYTSVSDVIIFLVINLKWIAIIT